MLATENYRSSPRIYFIYWRTVHNKARIQSVKLLFALHLIVSWIPFHARGMQFSRVFEFECRQHSYIDSYANVCRSRKYFSSRQAFIRSDNTKMTHTLCHFYMDVRNNWFYKKTKSTRGVLAVKRMCRGAWTLLGKCELCKNTVNVSQMWVKDLSRTDLASFVGQTYVNWHNKHRRILSENSRVVVYPLHWHSTATTHILTESEALGHRSSILVSEIILLILLNYYYSLIKAMNG